VLRANSTAQEEMDVLHRMEVGATEVPKNYLYAFFLCSELLSGYQIFKEVGEHGQYSD
jgi:hypothetical protein